MFPFCYMTAGKEEIMALCVMLLVCLGALAIPTAESQFQDAVDLSSKTLKTIPNNLPANITKLILSHNFIELSSPDMDALSTYQSLTELALDGNLIATLPDNLLSTLSPKLRILNLSHNNISVLQPKALNGSASLTELDLSYNHIASLPPELFTGLPGLKRIYLQSNRLQTMELEASTAGEHLEQLTLEDNPWDCSCKFVSIMKWFTGSGLLNDTKAKCLTPEELRDKSILNDDACSKSTQAPTTIASTRQSTTSTTTTTTTSTKSSIQPKPSNDSQSDKDTVGHEDGGSGGEGTTGSGGMPSVGNTWKLLVGVVVIALSTSVVIVCAIKSPSWYKLLFNYRHQRLREEGGPGNIWATGRYSNFSLETEQTDTSVDCACDMQEMEEEDEDDEDEDGFIEDRYIEPGDYKAPTSPEEEWME